MAAKGLSMRHVAELSRANKQRGFSYEHLRKIMKGTTIPSTWVLEALSRVLEIPYAKLLESHQASEARIKYGQPYLESLKLSPDLYEFEELIPALTKDQRKMVLSHVRALVAGNLTNRRSEAKGKARSLKRSA